MSLVNDCLLPLFLASAGAATAVASAAAPSLSPRPPALYLPLPAGGYLYQTPAGQHGFFSKQRGMISTLHQARAGMMGGLPSLLPAESTHTHLPLAPPPHTPHALRPAAHATDPVDDPVRQAGGELRAARVWLCEGRGSFAVGASSSGEGRVVAWSKPSPPTTGPPSSPAPPLPPLLSRPLQVYSTYPQAIDALIPFVNAVNNPPPLSKLECEGGGGGLLLQLLLLLLRSARAPHPPTHPACLPAAAAPQCR